MASGVTEPGTLIGASVQRVEDPRFLTGQGRYVDDITLPATAHAAFLRSPHPHARVDAIDARAARALPGVVAVYTAADAAGAINPIRVENGPGRAFSHTALPADKVRMVGDVVAMVVAEDRYIAEDAVDLIRVDYTPLPPVASMEAALDPSSPPLYEELGDNIALRDTFATGDLDGALAAADRVIRRRFVQQRYMNVPMETRGCLATYDAQGGELTVYASTQSPHGMRATLSQQLNLPLERVRVIAPDMGGGFGLKFSVQHEDLLVALAAMRTARPVKWIEDRRENLTASGHAREETLEVEAAVEADGTILGLGVRMTMDLGVGTAFSPQLLFMIIRMMLPAPYRFQHYRFESVAVVTNKAPYVAYRGPWAVETWVRETLVDAIARELGLDPVAVRRKNIVTAEDQPFTIASGITLERVSAHATLERAVALADLPRTRQEQGQARAAGRLTGFGLATMVEPAPGIPAGGEESAVVRVEPTGEVTVITSQVPHGQSHETTLAQVAAAQLGAPLESVRVVHGDTAVTPFGMGTGGSRAATMASGAVLFAARTVREQIFRVAAELFEASPDDLELAGGTVRVRGAPQRSLPLTRVAELVYREPQQLPPGSPTELAATHVYDGGEGGYSQATHCCWVAVDAETGKVEITRYLVVEDCGTMINPAVVEGQVRGGTAQGIGGVLYEHAVYDDDGQFLTSTFLDYLVPTATEVPPIAIEHMETPAISPVNFRGVGEGGAICAPPAITNAVADALGVSITRLPLTPTRILELLGTIPGPDQTYKEDGRTQRSTEGS